MTTINTNTRRNVTHHTGYHCWTYGEKTWHRTLDGAERKAAKESRWCDEVQIIEVATGNRVL